MFGKILEVETDTLSNGINARFYRIKYDHKHHVKNMFKPSQELLESFRHHQIESEEPTNLESMCVYIQIYFIYYRMDFNV